MNIILNPYEGYLFEHITYKFGNTLHSEKREEIFEIVTDNITNEVNELYSGRRVHTYLEEHLAYVQFLWDQSIYELIIEGICISEDNGIENIRNKYEFIESTDKLKTIIPALGLYIEDIVSKNKKKTKSIILFSKASFSYFAKQMKVITLYPYIGYSNICSTINYSMKPEDIRKLDGKSKKTIVDLQIMKDIKEHREEGIVLTFVNYNDNLSFQNIFIMEKNNIKVVYDQMSLFADGNHSRLKEKYEYEDSINEKLTLFPQLGIVTCGCGEKKNKGEGKYVIAFTREHLEYYRNYLDI